MVLKSKSFLIYKGDTLENITQYLSNEIGLNAFLIKDIQAVRLQDNLTQLTVLYNKYPAQIIDSIAPREGAIFTSDIASNNFDVRFLFNYPIDFRSIASGTFKIDGVGLDSSKIYLDPNSNNYFLKISASGNSFQTEDFHTYQIGSNLKRIDGSSFTYTPVGGYIFHDLSSAHIGDYFSSYDNRKRGTIAVGVLRLSKGLNPQQGIIEYLSQRQISDDRLISYYTVSTTDNSSDVYFIYLRKIEPQIVSGFPLNNSLLPDVSAPSKVTLVFNTKLDKAKLLSTSGLFTIESDFVTSVPVSTSHINLLDDLKTVEIDVTSYFTSQKVYSIIARPGILGLDGLAKEKPEQWTIHISAYEKGVGSGGGAPLDAQYLLYAPDPDLDNAYLVTGNINIHIASTSNPHSTTASQVGAPTLLQFTGHTGNLSNPHQVTAAQVGSPTISDFAGHTGITGVHFTQGQIYIPSSQIYDFSGSVVAITSSLSGVSSVLFTGHTGRTDIHFTEASINHANIQNIGTNSHAQIDSHISNSSNPHSTTAAQVGAPTILEFTGHTGLTNIHFTEASINHANIQNIGANTHAQIDTHIASISNPHSTTAGQVGAPTLAQFTGHTGTASIHYTVDTINHTSIQNIGTNTHAQIDTHLASTSNPHSTTASQVGAPTLAQFTGHTGDVTRHYLQTEIDHRNIIAIGTYQHHDIDDHIDSISNPHSVTAAQVGAPTTAQFTGHTGLTTVHFTVASINHTSIQNIGTNTHAQIDTHISNTSNPHSVTAAQVGAPTTAQYTGHTGQSNIHLTLSYLSGFFNPIGGTSSGLLTVTGNLGDVSNRETSLANLRQNYHVDDLFGVDYSRWGTTSSADAATYTPNPYYFSNMSANNEVGFLLAGLGATSNSTAGTVGYHNTPSVYLQSGTTMYFKIYTTSTTNCKYRFGLSFTTLTSTSSPDDGIYLEYTANETPSTWYLVAGSGLTKTSGNTTINGYSASWKWFGIYRNSTGYFAYDLDSSSTHKVQITANLPTPDSRICFPFIQTIGNGTAYASLCLDTLIYPKTYNSLPPNIVGM